MRADLVHAACHLAVVADMQKVIQGKSGRNLRLKGSDLYFLGREVLGMLFSP